MAKKSTKDTMASSKTMSPEKAKRQRDSTILAKLGMPTEKKYVTSKGDTNVVKTKILSKK